MGRTLVVLFCGALYLAAPALARADDPQTTPSPSPIEPIVAPEFDGTPKWPGWIGAHDLYVRKTLDRITASRRRATVSRPPMALPGRTGPGGVSPAATADPAGGEDPDALPTQLWFGPPTPNPSPVEGYYGIGALANAATGANATFGEGPSANLDGPAPVVLGENMAARVTPYARGIGAETIVDWLSGRAWSQQLNDAYIAFLKSEGRRVIDIGPDFGRRLQFKLSPPINRGARPVYESERHNLLQGGQANYNMIFERTGKYEGGVRGFDVLGRREGGPVGLN